MGRTKRGNANAQRNKNKKEPNRVSEELVEFTTGSKESKDQPVIDEIVKRQGFCFLSGCLVFVFGKDNGDQSCPKTVSS